MTTAIYIRVSTEEQAKEGFSIKAQKQKLTQYALARDWQIFDFYIDDGISGKNIKDRPEINRMLQDVKIGKVKNVLVYKIDRLTRSTKNLIELVDLFNQKDCAFNSLCESIDTASATGRMFLKIVGIFAEFERENLAERVSFGYEQKTREGNYTNTQGVYGYDYIQGSGELLVNEQEKEVVRDIFEMYLSGLSMCKIAKALSSRTIPTKRGGKWCQSTVASILSNPTYIGKVRYSVNANNKKEGFMVDGHHEAIIDVKTFQDVQGIMGKRLKYQSRQYPKENTYFLGALFCSKCGSKLGSTQHKKNRQGNLYVNYYDFNMKNGQCDCRVMSQNRVEQAFQKYIENISEFTPSEKILEQPKNNNLQDREKQIAGLEKEQKRIIKKMEDIKGLFLQDHLSFSEYQSFEKDLSDKLGSIRKELEELQPIEEAESSALNFDMVKDIVKNLKQNWLELTADEKRKFIFKFIDRIEIYSDGKNIVVSDCVFFKSKELIGI